MRCPRVLLADDHRMLREIFTQILEPCCDVVGAVGDGRALLTSAAELKPDVVVVDVSMPLLNGLDAARQLKRSMPEVKIVFLTVNEDPGLAAEAFRIGASGYLLKNSAAAELLRAITEAMEGRSYVTPLVAKELVESLVHSPQAATRHDLASPRQREVLQLLAEGHTMKKIARILNIKPRTVAFHKYGMMKNLGVKSTAQLLQTAFRLGVLSK